MPHYEETIALYNSNKETSLAIAYETLKKLEWEILYAGDNSLSGSSRVKWGKGGQQILCKIDGSELTVRSEMVNGELTDISGINKKNTAKFITAFEMASSEINNSIIEQNIEAIKTLRAHTKQAAEEHLQETAEVDKVMRMSGSNLYATYAIIAINIIVFILMAMDGAGVIELNDLVHIKWGSNYRPLTLSGDWWRLVTNVFIHFGIIHIAANMYCFYRVAAYLEPMLGKAKYITAYICTGIIASVASLWWHSEGVNSAGASGAIFGIYGLFFAFLTTSLIPQSIRQPLLKTIGFFILYNLLYGTKGGVDNAAHIGGLLSGLIIGYIYVYGIKKEHQGEQFPSWIIPFVIIATICGASYYLKENIVPGTERIAVLNQIKDANYKDNDLFNSKLEEFDKVHQQMNDILNDTLLTQDALLKKIEETGLPGWESEANEIAATGKYDISPEAHAKATKLLQYINMRKKEMELIKQINNDPNDSTSMTQLNEIRPQYIELFNELVK